MNVFLLMIAAKALYEYIVQEVVFNYGSHNVCCKKRYLRMFIAMRLKVTTFTPPFVNSKITE